MRVARWLVWVVLVVCTARIAAAEFVDGEVRAHLRGDVRDAAVEIFPR